MARVNVDEKWWTDPRRKRLIKFVGEDTADGIMLKFWRTGQEYESRNQSVPFELFDPEDLKHVLACNLAVKLDDGIYVKGSRDATVYLKSCREKGRKGGIKSGATRRSKINNLAKAQVKPSEAQVKPSEPSSSTSSSTSLKTKTSIPNGMLPGRAKSAPRETIAIVAMVDFGKIVTPDVGKRWESLYDPEYVQRELLKILNWLTANPKKNKKTVRGWVQFVSNWLDRGWPAYQRSLKTQGVG